METYRGITEIAVAPNIDVPNTMACAIVKKTVKMV